MQLAAGEFWFGALRNIEDLKGNMGKKGKIVFSNIRMIWYDESNTFFNLSIGFGAITHLEITENR